MKNILIFLSIIVVTLLAAADLRQRLAELDSISREVHYKTQFHNNQQKYPDSDNKEFGIDYTKSHK